MKTEYFFWDGDFFVVEYEEGPERQFYFLPNGKAVWFSKRSGSTRVVEGAQFIPASSMQDESSEESSEPERGTFEWNGQRYSYPYPHGLWKKDQDLHARRVEYFILDNNHVLWGTYLNGDLVEIEHLGNAKTARLAATVAVKLDDEVFVVPEVRAVSWLVEINGRVYRVYDTGYGYTLTLMDVLPSMPADIYRL